MIHENEIQFVNLPQNVDMKIIRELYYESMICMCGIPPRILVPKDGHMRRHLQGQSVKQDS